MLGWARFWRSVREQFAMLNLWSYADLQRKNISLDGIIVLLFDGCFLVC